MALLEAAVDCAEPLSPLSPLPERELRSPVLGPFRGDNVDDNDNGNCKANNHKKDMWREAKEFEENLE